MTEHPLQPHVLRLARRLHFAGIVIIADAVRSLGDGHFRIPSLADVDHIGLAELRRGVSSKRYEDSGNRMNAESHQTGNCSCYRKRPRRELRFREQKKTGE